MTSGNWLRQAAVSSSPANRRLGGFARTIGLHFLCGFLEVERGVSARWGYYTAPHSDITAPRARMARIACEYLGIVYAFQQLRLKTLQCEVLQSSAGVLRLHEHAGFEITGSRPSGDERPDFVLLQLTCQCWREDWAQRYFGDGTGLEIKPHALDA